VFTCHGGELWWFYSKHELFSPAAWAQLVAEHYANDPQLAFDDRLPDFDRIMTTSGSYLLATGECSMPEDRLAAILKQINGFFGFRPVQLTAALQRPMRLLAGPDGSQMVAQAASVPNANEVRTTVRDAALREGNLAALRALYAYRALDVPNLSCYLQAARHSCQIGNLLPHVKTVDEALRAVDAIVGTESIFDDPNRLAMPNETVRFATGTNRDKALLLHVLIERVLGADQLKNGSVETLFSDAGSFVRTGQFCINVSSMAYVPEIEGDIRYRIADAPRAENAGA
jgi:hypothetical protein